MQAIDRNQLIAAMPFPVLVIGRDREVIATNEALDAILGGDFVGRHFITALRQPALLDTIEVVASDGLPREAVYLGRDGARDTTYKVSIRRVGAELVLSFDDQTAAEEVGQFRRDFVANVSHELRTPLTALLGFVETLRGAARNDAEARSRFLDIMEREAMRMTRLVDDLLSLSRVEGEERIRPTESVSLGGLARSTLTELTPLIAKSGLTLDFNDQSDGAEVQADSFQIRQVIGNLVENAVKYAGSGKVITVDVSAPGYVAPLRSAGLILTVADEGPGIAAHHIPRLTERFYRVDAHRSREIGGTGLGLAIVKHIVNRHRGRFRIESDEGKGTSCTVILPLT